MHHTKSKITNKMKLISNYILDGLLKNAKRNYEEEGANTIFSSTYKGYAIDFYADTYADNDTPIEDVVFVDVNSEVFVDFVSKGDDYDYELTEEQKAKVDYFMHNYLIDLQEEQYEMQDERRKEYESYIASLTWC